MLGEIWFQITEYDYATATLEKALSFLYEREEIPAEVVRFISLYTLDCFDKDGNSKEGGTSKAAIELVTTWINDYCKTHDFSLIAKHLLNEDVNSKELKKCLSNGCIVLRTYQDCEHYVLITGIDEDYVYIWDPYYIAREYYDSDRQIEIIFDKLFSYNRKVKMSRFLSVTHRDFALGPIHNRECLCLYKQIK